MVSFKKSCQPDPFLDNVDWNRIWIARMKRHQGSEHYRDSLHIWNKIDNAIRYDEISRNSYGRRVSETIAGLSVNPGSRILDIGAGPGTLALPLAGMAKEVTVIEPAEGTVKVLSSHIERRSISNISIVNKRWEDVRTKKDLSGKYDLVIASLSLSMLNIRSAIIKMQSVCTGTVNLYWFVDLPFWEWIYEAIWKDLHGSPYFPGPKADCLYMVLAQMGIHSNVEVRTLDKTYLFSSREEMYDHFRERLGITDETGEEILRRYLNSILREDDSRVILSGDSLYAKLWWQTCERD